MASPVHRHRVRTRLSIHHILFLDARQSTKILSSSSILVTVRSQSLFNLFSDSVAVRVTAFAKT